MFSFLSRKSGDDSSVVTPTTSESPKTTSDSSIAVTTAASTAAAAVVESTTSSLSSNVNGNYKFNTSTIIDDVVSSSLPTLTSSTKSPSETAATCEKMTKGEYSSHGLQGSSNITSSSSIIDEVVAAVAVVSIGENLPNTKGNLLSSTTPSSACVSGDAAAMGDLPMSVASSTDTAACPKTSVDSIFAAPATTSPSVSGVSAESTTIIMPKGAKGIDETTTNTMEEKDEGIRGKGEGGEAIKVLKDEEKKKNEDKECLLKIREDKEKMEVAIIDEEEEKKQLELNCLMQKKDEEDVVLVTNEEGSSSIEEEKGKDEKNSPKTPKTENSSCMDIFTSTTSTTLSTTSCNNTISLSDNSTTGIEIAEVEENDVQQEGRGDVDAIGEQIEQDNNNIISTSNTGSSSNHHIDVSVTSSGSENEKLLTEEDEIISDGKDEDDGTTATIVILDGVEETSSKDNKRISSKSSTSSNKEKNHNKDKINGTMTSPSQPSSPLKFGKKNNFTKDKLKELDDQQQTTMSLNQRLHPPSLSSSSSSSSPIAVVAEDKLNGTVSSGSSPVSAGGGGADAAVTSGPESGKKGGNATEKPKRGDKKSHPDRGMVGSLPKYLSINRSKEDVESENKHFREELSSLRKKLVDTQEICTQMRNVFYSISSLAKENLEVKASALLDLLKSIEEVMKSEKSDGSNIGRSRSIGNSKLRKKKDRRRKTEKTKSCNATTTGESEEVADENELASGGEMSHHSISPAVARPPKSSTTLESKNVEETNVSGAAATNSKRPNHRRHRRRNRPSGETHEKIGGEEGEEMIINCGGGGGGGGRPNFLGQQNNIGGGGGGIGGVPQHSKQQQQQGYRGGPGRQQSGGNRSNALRWSEINRTNFRGIPGSGRSGSGGNSVNAAAGGLMGPRFGYVEKGRQPAASQSSVSVVVTPLEEVDASEPFRSMMRDATSVRELEKAIAKAKEANLDYVVSMGKKKMAKLTKNETTPNV